MTAVFRFEFTINPQTRRIGRFPVFIASRRWFAPPADRGQNLSFWPRDNTGSGICAPADLAPGQPIGFGGYDNDGTKHTRWGVVCHVGPTSFHVRPYQSIGDARQAARDGSWRNGLAQQAAPPVQPQPTTTTRQPLQRPVTPAVTDDTAGPPILRGIDIAPRTLLHVGARKPNETNVTSLDEVRANLEAMVQRQDPMDLTVTLSEVSLMVQDGMILADVPGVGLLGMTRTGLRGAMMAAFNGSGIQYGQWRVRTEHLLSLGLEQMAAILPIEWHLLTAGSDKLVNFRTVMTKDPRVNAVTRVIRAVTSSGGYTPIDDLALIDAVSKAGGDLSRACVPAYRHTDDWSSLRILPRGLPATTGTPVPMIELRNSETGCGSVQIEGGSYILRCTNGLFTTENKGIVRFNHTGNMQRIVDGIAGASAALLRQAEGVTEEYLYARTVKVKDQTLWLTQQMDKLREKGLRERTAKAALDLMGQHTDSAENTLGYCVDALTLAAQQEEDIDARRDTEWLAGFMMEHALHSVRKAREAGKEAILIPAKERKKGEAEAALEM